MNKLNIHNIFFWTSFFFLLGVVLASFVNNFLIIILTTLLVFFYFLLINKKFIAFLILFILVGFLYFNIFSYLQIKNTNISFDRSLQFEGLVVGVKNGSTQQLEVVLIGENSGKISLTTVRYPEFNYGDKILFTGTIKELKEGYKNYYLTKNIFGEISFPKIELVSKNNGSFIKSQLLKFRNKIRDIFNSILPKEKAAFLSGITIGAREDFSKDFKEKMSLSGTTHLVALSGYNISIIIVYTGLVLASIFSATTSFYLSILLVILFVVMTGAEASVVRAAIMGIILIISDRVERLFNPRNAIVLAAFVMVLFNPRVLVFDVGFQLSFAALLGIVYLTPVIKNIFKIEDAGLLSWKENGINTFSAQIMALPILLVNFGSFSLFSILANVLILGFIPITMGLGFVVASFGMFSIFLAKIIGVLVNIFITYEFFIINIFSKLPGIFKIENIGLYFILMYYFIIFMSIFIYKRKVLI